MEEKLFQRWKYDYIEDLDIDKIEYISLSIDELDKFFMDNYLDKETWKFVSEKDCHYRPIGLIYLNYDNYRNVNTHDKEKRYLLGITTNNKGTKTILSVMNYSDKYYVFEDQVEPITYINTIETNSYYKNKGLYKSLVKNMIRFINPNQHILTTLESDEGKLCSTHKILCEILKENGFNKTINVLGRVNVEEYHNLLTQNKKLTL